VIGNMIAASKANECDVSHQKVAGFTCNKFGTCTIFF